MQMDFRFFVCLQKYPSNLFEMPRCEPTTEARAESACGLCLARRRKPKVTRKRPAVA